LDGLDSFAVKEVSRRATRIANVGKASWLPIASGVLAVALVAAYLVTRTASSTTTPTPDVSAPATVPVAIDAPTPTPSPNLAPAATPAAPASKTSAIRWNFDTGLGDEFIDRAHWVGDEVRKAYPLPKWLPAATRDPDHSGALEFPADGASLFLKTGVPVSQLPIRFEFDLWVLDAKAMSIGIWTGRNHVIADRASHILKYEKDNKSVSWKTGTWIHVVRTTTEANGIITTRTLYDGVQRGDYLEEKMQPAWTDPKEQEFYEIYGSNFLVDNLRITSGN
jgi:hypothetical protein